MSFGLSVGDFLTGAELAYKLVQCLSAAKSSASEYQELMVELNVVHKVLLQVDQLRAANQLAQATTNSLVFTVAYTIDAMDSFLAAYESYSVSLQRDGSGNVLKDTWKKGFWALKMPHRVRAFRRDHFLAFYSTPTLYPSCPNFFKVSKLRQTLSVMLISINCLVSLACYFK